MLDERVEPPGAVVSEETPANAGQPSSQPFEQAYPPSYGQGYGQGYAQGYEQSYQQPYGAPGEPYAYGGQQAYPGYAYPGRRTNSLAVVSLVASIAGVTILPVLASIVGVITGHMARRQIRDSGEGGDGMAVAGLVIGWIGVGIAAAGVLVALLLLGGVAIFGFAAGGH